MSKSTAVSNTKSAPASNKPAPASTLAVLKAASAPVTAAPAAKVSTASGAVLVNITSNPHNPAGSLPANCAAFSGYLVALTKKGAAAAALQKRMLPTAKNGPCPFLAALYGGQGKTLAQAWVKVTATGHGQQGRGAGGYTAAQAISYYTTTTGWFTLVAPAKGK
jgi:hypothetical protein